MKIIMWAVYFNKSKHPDAIFRTKYLAKEYNVRPSYVKKTIVRVMVDYPKTYCYTVVRHQTKYIKT